MDARPAASDALTDLERAITDAVSIDEPWALVEEFSDLRRVSGTEDEERAAAYVTDRLDALGVSYDRYDPDLYISQPGDAAVRTTDGAFEAGPVKTPAFSESATVEGEVEYVGPADASDVGGDDGDQYHAVALDRPYADVGDLDGKVALTAAGSLSIRAARILEDAGAAGVVAIHEHDREPHDGIATPVWGGAPPLDEADRIPGIPVANVRRPDGETLKELAAEGGSVEVETDLTTDWMSCPIVVADVPAGAADTDEFVLLHGHYDSWDVGVTDNATGDGALLELARVFDAHSEHLERDLRVAWWPGHSTGRYAGSTWYADEYAHDIVENCVVQIDVDSPGAQGSREYVDMACWMPESHPLVAGTIEDVTGADYAENRPRRAGDYSFNNLGVTGCFTLSSNIPKEVRDLMGWHPVGGCGGNADAWHVSTDTLDKAGEDELLRDIRMYAVLALRVLNAEVLPFDHVRNLERHREIVEGYQEAAGEHFDFSPTLEAIEALHGATVEFYDAVEAGEVPAAEGNDAILRLGRTLTRLNFVADGQFEQDPAHHLPPYPRYAPVSRFGDLSSGEDEYRFLRLQLQRAQNEAVHELRRAADRLP